MLDAARGYIPVLTTEAGLCLTADNWQQAQVPAAAYYLDSLLLKPGYDMLKKIPDLKRYLGWHKTLILNASKFKANKEGLCTLVSPYDGAKIKLTLHELVELLITLEPDAVILPPAILKNVPDFWSMWNVATIPFFTANDLAYENIDRDHGIYFENDNSLSHPEFVKRVSQYSHKPCYVTGTVSLELMTLLKSHDVSYIESDEPARLAFNGIVYNHAGQSDIKNEQMAQQFHVIESACQCPTCSHKLTNAYLHHLLLHTPLLCQRFLIQHNVYFAENLLQKDEFI